VSYLLTALVEDFVGPCPHRDRDYRIGSNFWKFYLIRSGFTWVDQFLWWKCLDCLDWNGLFLVFGVWTQLGPEWTSTHQRTNVDGWCTDRIVFSIPVPSQVDVFCLPFLPWSQFFFATLFSHHLAPIFFFFLLLKLFPPTHPLPLTVPHRPTHLYIWINSKLFPIYLLTYIFELIVNSSPSTYSPINLKCVTLIPTYMATPTYMVATTIDPQQSDNDEERIKWQYCMELALVHSNKINKRTIKEFNIPI